MASTSRRTADSSFSPLLTRVQKQLDPRLSLVLKEAESKATGYGREVGDMVGAVRKLCERGGKRLRPALCVAGGLCADPRAELRPLISAGVSLELLQAYFLIHDDWMDRDRERRGGPTAHVSLSRRFRSQEKGAAAAILAGDYAVALAQAQLAAVSAPAPRVRQAMATFADMQIAAVMGQQLDIMGKTANPELTYELKTASYTVVGPLRLGAQLAGAKKNTLDTLEAFGLPAGVGFQLRDDLIGVFGDPKKTGKPRGADLTAGKNTSLVRDGSRLLRGKDRAALKAVFGNSDAKKKEVERAVALLEKSGARAAIESRIAKLSNQAISALDQKGLSQSGRKLLEDAAATLCDREM